MLADITDIGVVLQTCPGIAHALPERRSQVDKVKAIELRTTSKPVGEVALAVGYANASKFASTFRDAVGMAPAAYRESAGQER